MKEIAQSLEALIDRAAHHLFDIAETDAEARPAPGKWSKKEVMGHLIDSASNNHQRFVRTQETSGVSLPGYTQNFWVDRQGYQQESWKTLVALWTTYNTHLAHLIARIPEDCANNMVTVGDGKPVTLRWLAEDYVRHAGHHMDQILGTNPQ